MNTNNTLVSILLAFFSALAAAASVAVESLRASLGSVAEVAQEFTAEIRAAYLNRPINIPAGFRWTGEFAAPNGRTYLSYNSQNVKSGYPYGPRLILEKVNGVAGTTTTVVSFSTTPSININSAEVREAYSGTTPTVPFGAKVIGFNVPGYSDKYLSLGGHVRLGPAKASGKRLILQ